LKGDATFLQRLLVGRTRSSGVKLVPFSEKELTSARVQGYFSTTTLMRSIRLMIERGGLTGNLAALMPHAHLATPRSTARTTAKAVVTQIMFRRFDVMTANSPGCSNAFQDTFLRGLLCCLVTGFLCAMAISVSGAPVLEMPELWLPSLTGLGARVSSKIADATEETLNRGG
jgi:hypothetical protein